MIAPLLIDDELRIATLARKLKERIQPYVDARDPGGKLDPETIAFEAKMRKEAEELKWESFGVEVGHIPWEAANLLT